MENKAHALAAGIFVLVASALLIALAAWLTRDTGQRDAYEISTRETITGLQPQATVRYRGLEVGKVASIGFDSKTQGNVLLRLEIDHDAPVTADTFATLSYQGVTGLAFIQLDDNGKAATRLVPNDEAPPRIPLKPGLVAKLMDHSQMILDQIEQVTGRMNQLLGQDNQQRVAAVLDNLGTAAANASRLTERLDATMTQRMDPALAEVSTTMRSVRKSADGIAQVAADFDKTARRLNEKDGPLDRLAEGTAALSHVADSFNAATLPRINHVTEETSRAVRQLGRTANAIGDNPQSLIYGSGRIAPGPGEPGFTAPEAAQ